MSTPVCIANAVADASGMAEITLPLTSERMVELLRRQHRPPPPWSPEGTIRPGTQSGVSEPTK